MMVISTTDVGINFFYGVKSISNHHIKKEGESKHREAQTDTSGPFSRDET